MTTAFETARDLAMKEVDGLIERITSFPARLDVARANLSEAKRVALARARELTDREIELTWLVLNKPVPPTDVRPTEAMRKVEIQCAIRQDEDRGVCARILRVADADVDRLSRALETIEDERQAARDHAALVGKRLEFQSAVEWRTVAELGLQVAGRGAQ